MTKVQVDSNNKVILLNSKALLAKTEPVEGTIDITENGTVDVSSYESANVQVPNPSTGNKEITASTTTLSNIDVTDYATVSVNPTPSEEKSVTVNGDVTPTSGKLLSKVTVNVPNGTETKTITENGTYTPTSPNIGFSSVTVDINTVNNEDKSVTPTTSTQTVTFDSPYTGLGTVTVNPVTSSIDSDIKATNIKSGVNILGVDGSVVELKGQTRSVTENGTYTPESDYNGITSISVAVPNGVETKSITENGTYTPSGSNIGFSSVTVNVPNPSTGNKAITASTTTQTGIDVTDYATVSVAPTPSETQSVTTNGTVTPTSGKLLSSVTVAVPNGTETKSITENGTYTPTSPNIGFSSVTVDVASISADSEAKLNAMLGIS